MVEPIFDYQFRIILIGDSTVGKSSLLKYFTDGKFAEVILWLLFTSRRIITKLKFTSLELFELFLKLFFEILEILDWMDLGF